jgi:hypothetical protein
VVTWHILIRAQVSADRRSVGCSSGAHPEGKGRRRGRALLGRHRGCTWWWSRGDVLRRGARLRHACLDPRGGAEVSHSAPLHARLSRALARAPPAPGWWSRSVGVGSGREKLHVVTVAGRDEVEAPEPKHRAPREQAWLVRHPGNKRERRQKSRSASPLPGAPTVGVLTRRSGTN